VTAPTHEAHCSYHEPADADDEDLEQDDGVQLLSPAEIEENVLCLVADLGEHGRVARRFFKLTSFSHEQKERISTAIEAMIKKWRLVQATLNKQSTSDDLEIPGFLRRNAEGGS
jgi:hypothetical protein